MPGVCDTLEVFPAEGVAEDRTERGGADRSAGWSEGAAICYGNIVATTSPV